MAQLEFRIRQTIRKEIDKVSATEMVELREHTIQNMITKRIDEIAKETVSNTSEGVNWRLRVRAAAKQQWDDEQQLKALAVKLSTTKNNE